MLLIGLLALSSSAHAAEKSDLSKLDLAKLPASSTKTGLTYAKDIRPIFQASCLRCHGDEQQKGGLRLDNLEALLKGGKHGNVILPGKSKESHLVIASAQIDDETAMPPRRRPGGSPGGPGGYRGPSGAGAGGGQGGQGASKGPGGSGSPGVSRGPGGGGPGGPRGAGGPPAKPLTPEQVGIIRAWREIMRA